MQALRIVPSALFVDTYTQRNIKVQAVQWNGDNLAEIISVAGQANVNVAGEFLQVRLGDDRWGDVHLHHWVSRDEHGELTVHADHAFRRDWQKAE